MAIPFFWIFLCIAIFMTIVAIKIENNKAKLIVSNMIVIPLILCVTEVFCFTLNLKNTEYKKVVIEHPNMHQKKDYINYEHKPNIKVHSVEYIKNEKIYDVHYNIDQNGLRVTPSSNNNSNQCLLFFCCSFAFGWGLNDNETLPYYLGDYTEHKYKIFNFGVSGYGPHSMLSQLEHGLIDNKIKGCQNNTVIYEATPDHMHRIAGRYYGHRHDPKYSLISNKLEYQGYFDDNSRKFKFTLSTLKCLRKSQIYIYFHRYFYEKTEKLNYQETKNNIELYSAILMKSQKILKERYNTKRFIILFWDKDYWSQNYTQMMLEEFDKSALEYYTASGILPDYKLNYSKYYLKYNDGHPSRLANKISAKFLAKQLKSDDNYSYVKSNFKND